MTSSILSPDSDKRFIDSVLARGLVDPRTVAHLAAEHQRDIESGRDVGSLAERLCNSGVLDRGVAARVLQTLRAEAARESALEPAPPMDGKRVGSYALGEELGRGGMGVVYRAFDTNLRRPVALKMILDASRADLEERERFEREARATAKLSHPGIVQVFDAGVHEGKPFLVMELVEGRSFETVLSGKEALTPRRVAEVVRGVAEALQHAHEHGVVHRDVKPQNVLLDREGRPRLVDFGLARDSATNNLTVTGSILGTPAYLAPEQARGESRGQGPAIDIYALGAVLYRALVGRPPF
ncbi:MAG: serine/threonine-protein kinase, partial [Planctomycetota bacterium]